MMGRPPVVIGKAESGINAGLLSPVGLQLDVMGQAALAEIVEWAGYAPAPPGQQLAKGETGAWLPMASRSMMRGRKPRPAGSPAMEQPTMPPPVIATPAG